jgi:hypothetical protein
MQTNEVIRDDLESIIVNTRSVCDWIWSFNALLAVFTPPSKSHTAGGDTVGISQDASELSNREHIRKDIQIAAFVMLRATKDLVNWCRRLVDHQKTFHTKAMLVETVLAEVARSTETIEEASKIKGGRVNYLYMYNPILFT